jgi:hypothetical protein
MADTGRPALRLFRHAGDGLWVHLDNGAKDMLEDEPVYLAAEVEAALSRLTAQIETLENWRATVTATLHRPGGAFYEDVPKHIRELRTLLKTVVEMWGPWHDADCPSDDTCECSAKPIHDRINRLLGDPPSAALTARLSAQERP